MTNLTIFNKQYKLENETIFANAKEISEIFGIAINTVSEHIKNIFHSEELFEKDTCRIFRNVSNQPINYYSLDMIIAVGYRVHSVKATKFRIEATKVLKEFLIKGEVSKKELSKKELALMIIESEEAKEKAEQKAKMLEIENIQKSEIINEQEQLIEVKEKIINDHIKHDQDSTCSDVGRHLGLRPNKFVQRLKDLGYLRENNEAYTKYVSLGFFVCKFVKPKDSETSYPRYYITPKGFNHFFRRMQEGDFDDIKA